MERLQDEIQKDREIMNAELMKYDTSVETKRVIDKEISMLRLKMRQELKKKVDELVESQEQLKRENLIVKDLIGPGFKFKNLGAYLLSLDPALKELVSTSC